MKITDMAADSRPRERLQQYGPSALSNAELLAIILKSGTKKENVLEICQKLLAKYGLEKLSSCSLHELQEEYGIGNAKASQLVALFELYRRLPQPQRNRQQVRRAEDVAKLYLPKMQHLQQEQFLAVYVDSKNRIIAESTITVGILNASLIHPREVFYQAIKHLADGLLVIHNHPSGDPQPSKEDLDITRRLSATAEILGIRFVDHLILGKGNWWSWKETGNR